MNDEYLDFAKEQAEEAGKIMKRYFQADDIGTILKEDSTPLTVADTAINDLVIKRVNQKYPNHGVLGEEASYKPERELIWVVDPIDGTVPFSLGIPVSTFTIALVNREDGQPQIGVVFDPFTNRLYSAVKGQGALLNGKKIKASIQKELAGSAVSVLGYRSGIKIGKCIDTLYNKGAISLSLVSQAYSGALVASGDLIGSIFAYSSAWDNAASTLIVREAGGVTSDLEGQPRRYDSAGHGDILACTKEIQEQLIEIVKNAHPRH